MCNVVPNIYLYQIMFQALILYIYILHFVPFRHIFSKYTAEIECICKAWSPFHFFVDRLNEPKLNVSQMKVLLANISYFSVQMCFCLEEISVVVSVSVVDAVEIPGLDGAVLEGDDGDDLPEVLVEGVEHGHVLDGQLEVEHLHVLEELGLDDTL